MYKKIWPGLSTTDQKVTRAIAESQNGMIQEIRESLDMTTNQFNPYRMRLIRKGIVDGRQRGIVKFVLPMFKEFVMDQEYME